MRCCAGHRKCCCLSRGSAVFRIRYFVVDCSTSPTTQSEASGHGLRAFDLNQRANIAVNSCSANIGHHLRTVAWKLFERRGLTGKDDVLMPLSTKHVRRSSGR